MKGRKIEPDLYKQIKKEPKRQDDNLTALKYHLSVAKIVKIRASKDFEHFERMTRAEHPPLRETTAGKQIGRLLVKLKQLERVNDEDIVWIKTGRRVDA